MVKKGEGRGEEKGGEGGGKGRERDIIFFNFIPKPSPVHPDT